MLSVGVGWFQHVGVSFSSHPPTLFNTTTPYTVYCLIHSHTHTQIVNVSSTYSTIFIYSPYNILTHSLMHTLTKTKKKQKKKKTYHKVWKHKIHFHKHTIYIVLESQAASSVAKFQTIFVFLLLSNKLTHAHIYTLIQLCTYICTYISLYNEQKLSLWKY